MDAVRKRGQIRILATGVRFAEHPDPESELVELGVTPESRADLEASRAGELVYVTPWSFVEFVDQHGESHRMESTIHPPQPVRGRATSALLGMVAEEQQLDSALGIGGYTFTRFEFASAPRRIDIDADLAEKLDLD